MSGINLKLIIALGRTHKSVFGNIEKSLKEYGLSTSEFGVIEFLYHKGRQPVQEIADRILVTSGTITYVIDKLIQKQYVTREKCQEDKRKYYVDLTPKGYDLIETIFPKHEQYLENLFSGIDSNTKEQLTDILFALKDAVDSSVDSSA